MTRRTERVNHLIRQEISELLHTQLKDPRLSPLLTITEVSVSADLKYAKVFVSSIEQTEKQTTLDVLTGAAGFLRRELAKRMRLKNTPELSFYWDDSIERGAHLQKLIDQLTQ